MFFAFKRDFRKRKPWPGVEQYVVWGNNIMLVYAFIGANKSAPQHNHPHEQLVTIIEGEISFTVGDETKSMKAKDVVTVPSNIMHSAIAGPNGCVTVEIFSPPREEFKTT